MGRAHWIGVEALGMPGQRTFRLLAYSDTLSAQMWLEKEQLQMLAQAIARMLAEIDMERGLEQPFDLKKTEPAPAIPKPPDFPAEPDVDIRVTKLGLLYDPDRDLIAVEAYDAESEEEPPTLRCLTTRDQMEALQTNTLEVIMAGRPRCPFCGTPLSTQGMPHFCPPMNGHQKLDEA
jgi:uncharacterized repeat protein (TIGR03847 family)